MKNYIKYLYSLILKELRELGANAGHAMRR